MFDVAIDLAPTHRYSLVLGRKTENASNRVVNRDRSGRASIEDAFHHQLDFEKCLQ